MNGVFVSPPFEFIESIFDYEGFTPNNDVVINIAMKTPKNRWFESLSESAQRELNDALERVRSWQAAARLWERVLTSPERKRLGDNPNRAFEQFGGTIGMWRKLRGGSQPRAIVDLAYNLSFLDKAKRDWLLREIGEPANPTQPRDVPVWNQETGQLSLKDKVIRKVRIMAVPTNVQIILDAFERQNWPTSIKNPLPGGQQELHETLRSLKAGLARIRFHAQSGAKAISWELI